MKNFPWHEKNWETIERAWSIGRLPHALLLEGPRGLGKSDFALRIAALVLGREALDPGHGRSHPDLNLLSVREDKKQIVVEQVRELCAELAMTSYASGYKVAIIDPAERMNINAANSLLKTLEEPTDNTVLILVRSRLDTLPATVASRCQKLRFAVPPEARALEWLEDQGPDTDWRPLLSMVAGAPLAAVQAAEEGMDKLDRRFRKDLDNIASGRLDPVKAAADWSKVDPGITLTWLNGFVVSLIRRHARWDGNDGDSLQNPSKVLPLEQLFVYLDEVQASTRRLDGALNLQMMLENLLIPWASRLQSL